MGFSPCGRKAKRPGGPVVASGVQFRGVAGRILPIIRQGAVCASLSKGAERKDRGGSPPASGKTRSRGSTGLRIVVGWALAYAARFSWPVARDAETRCRTIGHVGAGPGQVRYLRFAGTGSAVPRRNSYDNGRRKAGCAGFRLRRSLQWHLLDWKGQLLGPIEGRRTVPCDPVPG